MKKKRHIKKLLIANRGEIAVRVIRACHDMGIRAVAVYSDADRDSYHLQLADEAYHIGGARAAESYLNQQKILEAAQKAKVDAVHPGYGFLSENRSFAALLEKNGIGFVGPGSEAISLLGDKTAARALAMKIGVPTIRGSSDAVSSEEDVRTIAKELGYPILLKAAAGGGGKGMRVVTSERELPSLLKMARSEAQSSFGDDRIYVEQYVNHPHHVEIQIIRDEHGNVVYLGERDCSIQRRHQKIIEESPSPLMTPDLRKAMGEAAVALVTAAGYTNAGTVEFLVDAKRNFYFLEVNTRLQVEHPVTEMVTGTDLVREQIRVTQGQELSFRQDDIVMRRHAIECRIYAEDPLNNFFPSTGTLTHYVPPEGPHVRVDNGFRAKDAIEVYYDPLISKVITWGPTRDEALQVMQRALREYQVSGVQTTIPFCLFVLGHPKFAAGEYDTHFVAEHFSPEVLLEVDTNESISAAILAALISSEIPAFDGSMKAVLGRSSGSGWKSRRNEFYRS